MNALLEHTDEESVALIQPVMPEGKQPGERPWEQFIHQAKGATDPPAYSISFFCWGKSWTGTV